MNFPNIPKELIFAGGLFATVTLLAYVLSGFVFKRDVDPRLKRLRAKRPTQDELPIRRGGKERFGPVVSSIGQAAGAAFMPKSQEKQSSLRRKLGYAGFYTAGSLQAMVGAKVILLVGGLA